MKNTIVLMAAAILAVGCDQQRQANNNTSTSPEKDQIRQSARDAKSEVDKQARAEKEMLDKEAKAAQAKIDAETARAKAAATDAQSKVTQPARIFATLRALAARKRRVKLARARARHRRH